MKFEFFKNPVENNSVVPKEEYISKVGKTPIRASLIDVKNIDEETQKNIDLIKKSGQFIDYEGNNEFFHKNKIRNGGIGTYMISEPNSFSKYSEGYYDCTGFIVVGEDKDGNEQISFLSHQDPKKFLKSAVIKEEFTKDISNSIQELKAKVKDKSIDVIIFGGNELDYSGSVEFLSDTFKRELGSEPTVVTGPNLNFGSSGGTGVYFDTQNRRLFLVRPSQKSKLNESYMPSELDSKKEEWKNSH